MSCLYMGIVCGNLTPTGGSQSFLNRMDFRPRTFTWIAASAFIVAVIFAVAMVAHWIPINDTTLGVLACTGAGSAIAKIVKARRGKHAKGEG